MTIHEQFARRRKAMTLADYCRANDISAAVLMHDEWPEARDALRSAICVNAKVNPASAETWAVVVGLLGAKEPMPAAMRAALPEDPFEGLT